MEDERRKDETEVEAHKIANRLDQAAGDETEAEKDEPDVEGHKLSHKLSHQADV